MSQEQWSLLPLWYAVFLFSTTCHEAAHALAAHWGGDDTAYHGGQVSLNPGPHIRREPFGTLVMPLLSFLYLGLSQPGYRWMIGWASAPFDPLWEHRHPKRAAVMAAAGPLANLLLALAGFIVLKAGLASGVWTPSSAEYYELDRLVQPAAESARWLEGLGRLCSVLLSLNTVLFLFNLMPLPPLDGASVVAGLFGPARQAREMLGSNSAASLVGLLVAWYVFGYVFWPLYEPVLLWLYA